MHKNTQMREEIQFLKDKFTFHKSQEVELAKKSAFCQKLMYNYRQEIKRLRE
jgi:hypothetical protein